MYQKNVHRIVGGHFLVFISLSKPLLVVGRVPLPVANTLDNRSLKQV